MAKFWEWLTGLFASAKHVVFPERVLPTAPNVETTPPPPLPEPERPNKGALGLKSLRYPWAVMPNKVMHTHGKYPQRYPEGAIVHFTDGWSKKGDADALNTVDGGVADGYCYFVISNEGRVFQAFSLDDWGYHAGVSSWPGLPSISNRLVGIEICCGGKVEKLNDDNYVSDFHEHYKGDEVRVMPQAVDNVKKGFYHKYTQAQEEALVNLLLWLKGNNPDVFRLDWVLGHDEVAPTRKDDPGGSLSMTMPKFRELIQDRYSSPLIKPQTTEVKL